LFLTSTKTTMKEQKKDLKLYKNVNFLIDANDGIKLSEFRIDKLEKGLLRLDSAEQYALKASKKQDFECHPCQVLFYTEKLILLSKNDVCRYGITELGQEGRGYSDDWLIENGLRYVIQFSGNIRDCLYEERKKIFYYALLVKTI
jgi:hypothetical protein